MNNKGFTLLELLATIVLLAIIMSVTTVSIVNVIKTSKEKEYEILIKDIKIAAQMYFEECENKNIIESKITCPTINGTGNSKNIETSLIDLVNYGFLKTTATGENSSGNTIKIIKNPSNDQSIGNCKIIITKINNSNNISYSIEEVEEVSGNYTDEKGNTITCPSNADYAS